MNQPQPVWYNRYLWYELWPVECYNQLGRYDEVIKLAPPVIASAQVFAEARYEPGLALAKTGRTSEAIVQLKKAALDDANYAPIYQLLAELGN